MSLDSEGGRTDNWIGNGRRLSIHCFTSLDAIELAFFPEFYDHPEHPTELPGRRAIMSITVGGDAPVVIRDIEYKSWGPSFDLEGAAFRIVADLFIDADSRDDILRITVSDDAVTTSEDFDVTGFATNFNRLVCEM